MGAMLRIQVLVRILSPQDPHHRRVDHPATAQASLADQADELVFVDIGASLPYSKVIVVYQEEDIR